MQIVGRTYEDASVFQAAAAYEAAVGGWYRDNARRPKL
jgi:amidase